LGRQHLRRPERVMVTVKEIGCCMRDGHGPPQSSTRVHLIVYRACGAITAIALKHRAWTEIYWTMVSIGTLVSIDTKV